MPQCKEVTKMRRNRQRWRRITVRVKKNKSVVCLKQMKVSVVMEQSIGSSVSKRQL